MRLSGCSFNWNSNIHEKYLSHKSCKDVGFVAQDVQNIIPEVINKQILDDNVYLTVNYSKVIPYLVEAYKQREKKNKQHRIKVTTTNKKATILLSDLNIPKSVLPDSIQAWISAVDVLGYGRVSLDTQTLDIAVSEDGQYNLLIIWDEN